MTPDEMDRLVKQHTDAEMAGDLPGALGVYADDVVHDVVGFPAGPQRGPAGARVFYEYLAENFRTESLDLVSARYGDDFCVQEHTCTGTAHGVLLGVPGGGRRVSFRMLHVFDFARGRIARENVWLDAGSIVAQLTS